MYKDASIKQYLDDLAAKLPAPGGGSAAALTAGLGQALVSMVINFTLGKPKYKEFEPYLTLELGKSEMLRREFLDLVDRDVEAYNSKDPRKALDIPVMVARLCFEGVKMLPELVIKGNVNLISDVAVAAQLLESAFSAAVFNVDINLKFIDDEKLARELRKELAEKGKIVNNIRQDTEVQVGKIIRG
jgi:methenyltetrahydrofolate cyclohydrolase